jgi:heme exporter protein D
MGQIETYGRANIMNLQEFLAMGGYGFYVWTSYGIATIILVANIVLPILQRKSFLRQQALKQKRQEQ